MTLEEARKRLEELKKSRERLAVRKHALTDAELRERGPVRLDVDGVVFSRGGGSAVRCGG